MATPDFLLCDVCGAQIPHKCRVAWAVGREMGPAGSTETVVKLSDLCAVCWAEVVKEMAKISDEEAKTPAYFIERAVFQAIDRIKKRQTARR